MRARLERDDERRATRLVARRLQRGELGVRSPYSACQPCCDAHRRAAPRTDERIGRDPAPAAPGQLEGGRIAASSARISLQAHRLALPY